MNDLTVKELMVPLAEYAVVSDDATLYEVVLALEGIPRSTDSRRDPFRAVLVLDRNNRLIGKINLWDVLKGIEPRYREMGQPRETACYGLSPGFINSMVDTYGLWQTSLEDLCREASQIRVTEIMHEPGETEYIDEDAPLEQAINQLVVGYHQSLLVTRGEDIVGVLRLTDVFREIRGRIKACRS